MLKLSKLLVIFFIASFSAGCGGDNSTTTAATTIIDTPSGVPFSSYSSHLGGAVQGKALPLSRTVSTFAGSFGTGSLVDSTGTAAKFNHPTDITTDGTNFYVTDYLNNAIRQIDANGVVTTLVGTDADTGLPISFNRPTGITTDGKSLYVADSGNNAIRFINIASKKVITIGSTTGLAGSVDTAVKADARFSQPTGITTDGINVYVTDSANNTIRWIQISTNTVRTLAGTAGAVGSTDGEKATARFNHPAHITTDGPNLYVTDFSNRTIRKIVISSGAVTTIAGKAGTAPGIDDANAIGADARFYQPNGITTDGTNLYITDSYNNTIRKISLTAPYNVEKIAGITYGQAGSPGHVDSIEGTTPSFDTPIGITTDGISLFVADNQNNTIRKIK